MRLLSSLCFIVLLAPTLVLAADVPAQDLLAARPQIIEYVRNQRPVFKAAILQQQKDLAAKTSVVDEDEEGQEENKEEEQKKEDEKKYPDISEFTYEPSTLEQAMLEQFNSERTSITDRPLVFHSLLFGAAKRHAEDMFDHDFFDHAGSDKSTTATRIKDSGYIDSCKCNYKFGEILADGATSVQHAVQLWLESPPHRKILLDPDYVHVGIYKKGSYWVANFGMLTLP